MQQEYRLRFKVPEVEEVEVVFVRLADGRIVARTLNELEAEKAEKEKEEEKRE